MEPCPIQRFAWMRDQLVDRNRVNEMQMLNHAVLHGAPDQGDLAIHDVPERSESPCQVEGNRPSAPLMGAPHAEHFRAGRLDDAIRELTIKLEKGIKVYQIVIATIVLIVCAFGYRATGMESAQLFALVRRHVWTTANPIPSDSLRKPGYSWRCRESNPGPCRIFPSFYVCSCAIAFSAPALRAALCGGSPVTVWFSACLRNRDDW